MFECYRRHCMNKVFTIKTLYLYRQDADHWILCFPTKIHWKNPSNIEWIEYLLKRFVESYKQRGITSIAFPMLGCNNGGLKKEDVLPLMKKYLSEVDIDVEIYG